MRYISVGRRRKILVFTLVLLAFSFSHCKKKNPIEGFDSETWIEDANGCQGKRMDLMNDFLKAKFKMRGKKISEIEEILGKPDGVELYKRDQKYYIYYMEPGDKCADAKDKALKLYVRFTAVGIANEFSIRY